jgi:uncharacterized protein YqgC (DUF456 family)
MALVYYIVLLLLLLLGLVVALVGLPGLWVMMLATIAYAWITHWTYVYIGTLSVVFGLCLASEAGEFLAGAVIARRAGGSRRAMIAAAVGAVIGGIFFTFIPIPGVAQIIGACIGAALGAIIAELTTGRDVSEVWRVGVGAAKGRFIGTMLKLSIGITIILIVVVKGFPW